MTNERARSAEHAVGAKRLDLVGREIDDEQAEWVRWIFERHADGRTRRWIAAELNRLVVPAGVFVKIKA